MLAISDFTVTDFAVDVSFSVTASTCPVLVISVESVVDGSPEIVYSRMINLRVT